MRQIPGKKLSHKQLSALSHIALSGSISEGARQAGVSRSSIYRWLNDPTIRRELDTLREEIADIARTKLHHMTLEALQVIESSLHDESQRARFRAAVATIRNGPKVRQGPRRRPAPRLARRRRVSPEGAPVVSTRLRALERRLVRERATVAVHDFADRVSLAWDDLLDQPARPHAVLDLVWVAWDRGIGLPTLPAAINYLEDRLRKGESLNHRTLISIMAPWSVRRLDAWK